MSNELQCESCATPLPEGASICEHCGWDLTTSLARPRRQPLAPLLLATAWRLLLYGGLVALAVVGFHRFRLVGPGPDLATTLRWIVLGDNGRSAELVTIHRAHEIAAAAARYALDNLMAPSFQEGWAEHLERYATIEVRGWVPLLFYAASLEAGPAVLELYEVRPTDGWGNPYQVEIQRIPKGARAAEITTVAHDFDEGLQISFFAWARPELGATEWARLRLISAGADGTPATGDDIELISYLTVDPILDLHDGTAGIQRQIETALLLGRHYFRLQGNHWDLIDARILAEHRVEMIW